MAITPEYEFLRCYTLIKKLFEDKNEGILMKSTSGGRIFMKFKDIMALGHIVDEGLMLSYEASIRKTKNKFASINLDYASNTKRLLREFTFDLAVSNVTLSNLLQLFPGPVIVEATVIGVDVTIEPSVINLPAVHPPVPKKNVHRNVNKASYSSKYVDEFCIGLVGEIKKLISDRLSGRTILLDLIKLQILQRLERHLVEKEKDESMFITATIVDNIKKGIDSMRQLGSNDKEQFHIQEIIAIFTAGTISIDKQKEFTGLSQVAVEYGILKRKEYELIAENEREKLRKAVNGSSSSNASNGINLNENQDGENNDSQEDAYDTQDIIDRDKFLADLWGSDSDTDGGVSDDDEVYEIKNINIDNISGIDHIYKCDIEEDNRMDKRPRLSEGRHSIRDDDSSSVIDHSNNLNDSNVGSSGVDVNINASQSILKKRSRDNSIR
jgi:hypothetical protein